MNEEREIERVQTEEDSLNTDSDFAILRKLNRNKENPQEKVRANNYLRAVEDAVEQNDNSFDGIINNLPEEASSSVFVSVYNFSYLMGFDRWTIYNISPESGIIRYASATGSISSEMIVSTITASMLMTLVYVVLGYALFRRNEMN